MMPGTHFHPVLGDKNTTEHSKVDTVIFCSGKHYYDLEKQRTKQEKKNVSIIRVEVINFELSAPLFNKNLRDNIFKHLE